jgi:hypothetical protein
MEGFFHSKEKLEIYNRAAHVLDNIKDDELRRRMSETFTKFRALNREWEKMVCEEQSMQARHQRALVRALAEFKQRGVVKVEKDVLMAVAWMLVDFNLV